MNNDNQKTKAIDGYEPLKISMLLLQQKDVIRTSLESEGGAPWHGGNDGWDIFD